MIGQDEVLANCKTTAMAVPGEDRHHAFLPLIRLFVKRLRFSRGDDNAIGRFECRFFDCFAATNNYISKFFIGQKISCCLSECINNYWINASFLAF
jgi:hypothetical protein